MAKIRKKYAGPKYVAKNPMVTFLGSMHTTHESHLLRTNVINHQAMAAISTGTASREDWNRLVGAINIAIVMSEQGIGPEYRDELMLGQDALLSLGVRSVETDRFVFKGSELTAVNNALAVHDLQLKVSRMIDLDRAAEEVERRVRHRINGRSVMTEIRKMEAEACLP